MTNLDIRRALYKTISNTMTLSPNMFYKIAAYQSKAYSLNLYVSSTNKFAVFNNIHGNSFSFHKNDGFGATLGIYIVGSTDYTIYIKSTQSITISLNYEFVSGTLTSIFDTANPISSLVSPTAIELIASSSVVIPASNFTGGISVNGDSSFAGNISTTGNVTLTNGNIVLAAGGITLSNGNIVLTNGNVTLGENGIASLKKIQNIKELNSLAATSLSVSDANPDNDKIVSVSKNTNGEIIFAQTNKKINDLVLKTSLQIKDFAALHTSDLSAGLANMLTDHNNTYASDPSHVQFAKLRQAQKNHIDTNNAAKAWVVYLVID